MIEREPAWCASCGDPLPDVAREHGLEGFGHQARPGMPGRARAFPPKGDRMTQKIEITTYHASDDEDARVELRASGDPEREPGDDAYQLSILHSEDLARLRDGATAALIDHHGVSGGAVEALRSAIDGLAACCLGGQTRERLDACLETLKLFPLLGTVQDALDEREAARAKREAVAS